jgi:hypothetical protein
MIEKEVSRRENLCYAKSVKQRPFLGADPKLAIEMEPELAAIGWLLEDDEFCTVK